ncbi:N-acetylmuramoyl-L-alanine amidase AmiD precursor [Microbulbifer aggregans]|uniref:N-acetylmuramoyl-L-alanine amidase n=1 Tax=Microbulbifer aggregans TaxID=1769779 RepID=A0A1C9WAP6_9GAMM|nr:N-acetylmuramoyl-L-alanine amidase [Microbulbifer aggregans]AOS98219.1 N-acetylmuramoyl-L-alanine amidase AmiD precursor [Microbulbifer aggregans]
MSFRIKRPLRTVSLLGAACALVLTGCTTGGIDKPRGNGYKIERVQSENASERVRFLVMHFTTIDFDHSLRVLTQPSSAPVSSHYLVPENNDPTYPHDDLRVYQLVDEDRRAWHAGPARWEDRYQINDQSIGIEIVNRAHCHPPVETSTEEIGEEICFFPEFDPEQIDLVIALSKDILARYPDITPTRVIGHGDVVPQYKIDPGPRFPWQKLAEAGIGAWYEEEAVKRHMDYLQGNTSSDRESIRRRFAQWLADYGYGIDPETASEDDITLYTRAFQFHFRPWKVDGEVDNHSRAILLALLEKYFPSKLSGYPELKGTLVAELDNRE